MNYFATYPLVSAVLTSLLIAYPLAAEESELLTKTYQISPSHFQVEASNSGDPFAPQSAPNRQNVRQTIQTLLEEHGVEFPPGASARYNSNTSETTVKNTAENLKKVEDIIDAIQEKRATRQLHIFLEYIEVESALYHDWMYQNRLTGDGTPLRKQAQNWLNSEKATVIDIMTVTARSGQRARAESVKEIIYPTEPGTPKAPSKITLEGEGTRAPVAASTPSAYDLRKVGATLEVDPVLGIDNVTLDLNLSPEINVQNGFTHWPPATPEPNATFSIPRFHSMRMVNQITLQTGRYGFLGTVRPLTSATPNRVKPLILVFVRADVATISN